MLLIDPTETIKRRVGFNPTVNYSPNVCVSLFDRVISLTVRRGVGLVSKPKIS